MKIIINGKERVFDGEVDTLSNILSISGNDGDYFAVALNRDFIPKFQYEKEEIREGDIIEIVTPHPGG